MSNALLLIMSPKEFHHEIIVKQSRQCEFDPEKILYWPIFGLWTREGMYFQFLKSPHSSPLRKLFYRQLFLLTSAKIWNPHISATKIVWRRLTPLWNPLTKVNSFKYFWLWLRIYLSWHKHFFICWRQQKFEIYISQHQKIAWGRSTPL